MFLVSEFKDSVILQQCAVHIVWLASLCHPSSITDSRFIQVVPRVSRISSCLAQMNHEMEFRVQTPSDRPWICQRLAIELIVQHAERPSMKPHCVSIEVLQQIVASLQVFERVQSQLLVRRTCGEHVGSHIDAYRHHVSRLCSLYLEHWPVSRFRGNHSHGQVPDRWRFA